MIYKSIDELKIGDINTKTIFSSSGVPLLKEQVVLTIGIISKLRNLGVKGLYIYDERFANIKVDEMVSDETKMNTLIGLSDVVRFLHSKRVVNPQFILNHIDKISSEIIVNRELLLSLTDIRTSENHSFVHAINVAIVSITIAMTFNFTSSEIKQLATAALLHELIDVSQPIKGVHLDEDVHKILKRFNTIDSNIQFIHNEKKVIDQFLVPNSNTVTQLSAEIIALSDYYDSLISPFSLIGPYLPHESCEFLMGFCNKAFRIDLVQAFLKLVSVYPNGYTVRLENGKLGIVSRQNPKLPMRPFIQLLSNSHSLNEATVTEEVDLALVTTLFIKQIVK
ncbi:hypothetical protein EJF36_07310 [Bacillus sp. HMF5848]|uniref:HD-GYP domain-containing protein n=1 Tax=Bacillus sp. HMF5848 TaxID=2495421 RepID=UPI000F79E248|nr:hypothetical protein [Bacillus sp. HMF5848]RSK26681.1 hypothetical protein EJF36_07310 [Bacillus sp. HMF5848]